MPLRRRDFAKLFEIEVQEGNELVIVQFVVIRGISQDEYGYPQVAFHTFINDDYVTLTLPFDAEEEEQGEAVARADKLYLDFNQEGAENTYQDMIKLVQECEDDR